MPLSSPTNEAKWLSPPTLADAFTAQLIYCILVTANPHPESCLYPSKDRKRKNIKEMLGEQRSMEDS